MKDIDVNEIFPDPILMSNESLEESNESVKKINSRKCSEASSSRLIQVNEITSSTREDCVNQKIVKDFLKQLEKTPQTITASCLIQFLNAAWDNLTENSEFFSEYYKRHMAETDNVNFETTSDSFNECDGSVEKSS